MHMTQALTQTGWCVLCDAHIPPHTNAHGPTVYYSKEDSRVFVPKRDHLIKCLPKGKTLNMAQPESWGFVAALAGLCAWALLGTRRDSEKSS